jgi:hypothetical protein
MSGGVGDKRCGSMKGDRIDQSIWEVVARTLNRIRAL